jgi:hypothetical protein
MTKEGVALSTGAPVPPTQIERHWWRAPRLPLERLGDSFTTAVPRVGDRDLSAQRKRIRL